jgi:hypothetical protein
MSQDVRQETSSLKPGGGRSRWTDALRRVPRALSTGVMLIAVGACGVDGDEPAETLSAAPGPLDDVKVPVMGQVFTYGLVPGWPVPADFPVMLGCTDEETAHPDREIEATSRRICEAAQLVLHRLSEVPELTDDQRLEAAQLTIGIALERLAILREGEPEAGPAPATKGQPKGPGGRSAPVVPAPPTGAPTNPAQVGGDR